MEKLTQTLVEFIRIAVRFGLHEEDSNNARCFLEENELGLCFDTVITQMYEYDIEIDEDFYAMIHIIGTGLNLEREQYTFMKDLIKGYSST